MHPTPIQSDLPAILFTDDLSALLKLKRSAVAKAMNRGEFGRFGRLGRRLFVRRETLVAALAAREVQFQNSGGGR